MRHRRVDWANLPTSDGQVPVAVDGRVSPQLTALLGAFDAMSESDDIDAILRRAVELARECIGLSRVSIYLRYPAEGMMRGTWGTDMNGVITDEHAITFGIWDGDKAYYERLAREGVYWTVVENAPLVVHSAADTKVVGRGWVCSTPIRSGSELLGMMFNDEGTSGASVDDAKQSQVAVLCSLVGTAVDLARRRGQVTASGNSAQRSPTVGKAARLLAKNPALTAEDLGAELHLSASRVARVFKAEMGVSLVEYRNRLRLERFTSLLNEKGENLLEAALAAGFGSYAQFHRVFLAERGMPPGKFLRARRAPEMRKIRATD